MSQPRREVEMKLFTVLVCFLPVYHAFTLLPARQPANLRTSYTNRLRIVAAAATEESPINEAVSMLEPEPEPELSPPLEPQPESMAPAEPDSEPIAVVELEPEPEPEPYMRTAGVRVQPGDLLPDITVEPSSRQRQQPRPVSIGDALGDGTTILVGMPGAFTPTCTDKHLPGLFAAADKFASLNVSQVAVITTNDRFVNQGWAESVEACCGCNASSVLMLSDTTGGLIDDIGLTGETGFGLSVRAKRFAIVLEDQVVKYVAVDEGRDALVSTSAEALIRYLDPTAVSSDLNPVAVGVVGALGLAAAALFAFNTGAGVAPVDPTLVFPSEAELAQMNEEDRAAVLEKKAAALAAAEAAKAEAKATASAKKAEEKAAAQAAKAEAAEKKAQEKAAKAEAKAAASAKEAEEKAASEAATAKAKAAASAKEAEEKTASEAAKAEAAEKKAQEKAAAEAAKAEAKAASKAKKAEEKAAAQAAKAEAAEKKALEKAAAQAAKAESKVAALAAQVPEADAN